MEKFSSFGDKHIFEKDQKVDMEKAHNSVLRKIKEVI